MIENLTCGGCSKPICVGDKILVLDFNEDIPASIIHMELDCLLQMEEVTYGTLGPLITCNGSSVNHKYGLTRIK